jgi:hypothetical protein
VHLYNFMKQMSIKNSIQENKSNKYHCYKCNYSEWAPVGFVDEFADMDGYCDGEYSSEQKCKKRKYQ